MYWLIGLGHRSKIDATGIEVNVRYEGKRLKAEVGSINAYDNKVPEPQPLASTPPRCPGRRSV